MITDPSPLRGLLLTSINLEECAALSDVRFVDQLPKLHRLALPKTATTISHLRNHPRLTCLGYGNPEATSDFWRQYDRRES